MPRLGLTDWYDISINQSVQNDPVKIACLLLKRIKTTTETRRSRLLFVMQWSGPMVRNWRARPREAVDVLACAKRYGLEIIDTWDPLRAASVSNPKQFEALYLGRPGQVDGHMSRAGNEFIADLLAPILRGQ